MDNTPIFSTLQKVTAPMVERLTALEFAGFLVQEDKDAIYVADVQGTWAIPRGSMISMNDWEPGMNIPPYLAAAGRPVRVAVADGATIHEIRPWKIMDNKQNRFPQNIRSLADSIFTLGGKLPVSDRSSIGERELAALETAFYRKLGWNPNTDPNTHPVVQGSSGTLVMNDGYCDVDKQF